jgi:hypothetical protein
VPRLLWYLGTDHRGVKVEWFFLGVTIRDVAVLVLMGLVVRDILRPDGDIVRISWLGVDDPAGGVLDGRGDRFVVPSGARRAPRRRDGAAQLSGGTASGRGAARRVAES